MFPLFSKSKKTIYTAAVIGCGRIGYSLGQDKKREQPASHTAALIENQRIKLIAGCDTDLSKAEEWHSANYPLPAYMNTANLIVGVPQTIGGKNVLVRIPTIKELCTADSTLGGILDIADAFTNFDTAAANKELVQENFNLSQGLFTWSNTASATTSNAAANTATAYGRIVLLYPESSKATDVFH